MQTQWTTDLLPKGADTNRPATPLQPQGLVIHSTANPGADARAHRRYWGSARRGSSCHGVIDWNICLRIIPENEVAWHAGPTANSKFLGYELCESNDRAQFQAAYDRLVWAASDAVQRYGWGIEGVRSHRQISDLYKETDHTDPDPYLARWGKTWADLLRDIQAQLWGRELIDVVLPTGRTVRGEVRDGATYIRVADTWGPLRAWAETLGLRVRYDQTANKVEVLK